MEEEEHTDRKQQLAMLYQKLNKIKKSLHEGNISIFEDGYTSSVIYPHLQCTLTCVADDTDNINQVISSNSPESCRSYLMDLEKKGDPYTDGSHLTRLVDSYTRVFSNMPLCKHCENESYARMLVRFAELKVIQDVNEAEANFKVARSHCQNFAFVHIAHAQFEHSQGNTKRAIYILQNALELGAKPKEILETALQSMQGGKSHICSEDKENIQMTSNSNVHDSVKKGSVFQKVSRTSDGTGDLQLYSIFNSGSETYTGSSDDQLPGWKSGSQRKRVVGIPGRVPIVPFSIPENNDDQDDGYISAKNSKRSDASIHNSLSRQTSASSITQGLGLSSSKRDPPDTDLHPQVINPDYCPWEDQAPADSTTTLLHTRDPSKLDDVTGNFDLVVKTNSPESCWAYLTNLERRGNPHTDINLLNKLKDCYSKVFSKLQIQQFSKNVSYAKILVRYAELRGIEDPDEAQDHFIVARSNCKGFAFVHIAHAQFEVSQGNVIKATSILNKAQAMNAKPAQLLEMAISNLKTGAKQLVPSRDEEKEPSSGLPVTFPTAGGNQEVHVPARPVEQPKGPKWEPLSEWKIPTLVSRHVSPEEKRITPPEPGPISRVPELIPIPSRQHLQSVCQTPNSSSIHNANSFVTPVVKRAPEVPFSAVAPRRTGPAQHPFTPISQTPSFQTPQSSLTSISNESITIKGKQFFVLKMIGRGGSSKVYQVRDHKNQLFAVKYVDLEEADSQTIESYKNEIEHLNHLQQYSDQIIKLYDYEITNSCIYMLMECGNLDLNTWLRNRKTVDPLERKMYWKNMLKAVQTIHNHGIVHSDLKPANFVIVNASLKLIDFGIANRIQPDVTSIMKDSQVGTLNYMPPEAIKDTSSKPGKARSKISPKGDVWSLGCILYCMTYGKTPFQSITNQIAKLQAIIDPSHEIDFPDIPEKDLLDVLKRCLIRNPRERICIAELLEHPYLQLKPQMSPQRVPPCNGDLKKILTDLAALQSPNSLARAVNNLAKMCSSGHRLDVAECAKPPS
ncbi:hypothetical protein fugu_010447 [Takifugu bimaculatus]|uniref:Protein kinase domain-containing protein n=1 Tax=Takifugu bimaculatus TaxID=433685 RepID=A0A4Z2CFP1_9TELE|nr:hypothetical protein fugu_010447 [Takifugu bimaculatus]